MEQDIRKIPPNSIFINIETREIQDSTDMVRPIPPPYHIAINQPPVITTNNCGIISGKDGKKLCDCSMVAVNNNLSRAIVSHVDEILPYFQMNTENLNSLMVKPYTELDRARKLVSILTDRGTTVGEIRNVWQSLGITTNVDLS